MEAVIVVVLVTGAGVVVVETVIVVVLVTGAGVVVVVEMLVEVRRGMEM